MLKTGKEAALKRPGETPVAPFYGERPSLKYPPFLILRRKLAPLDKYVRLVPLCLGERSA